MDSDAPWGDLHGSPLAERGLASMLKRYDVRSMKVNVGGESLQGYRREHLYDAWQRYLPLAPQEAEPVEPVEPGMAKVPEVPDVPDAAGGEGAGQVHCRDCAYFDAEASLCLMVDRPVDPERERRCPQFAVPL